MDIRPRRMIHLGYGKFWRSDEIVGLTPIEDERGPGRRTQVWVSSSDEPIVASRSEQAIIDDISAAGDAGPDLDPPLAAELLDELRRLSPALRKMLLRDSGFDVERWELRLRARSSTPDGADRSTLRPTRADEEQEDLFADAH